MLSKGKYVMTMDEDDIYVQKEALSLLYTEAEKNNLDILGFVAVYSGTPIIRERPDYSDKKRIIYQPELSNLMFNLTSNGTLIKFGGSIWNLLIRKDLYQKVIKQIDEKNMNIRTNLHDDRIIFFLLTRSAKSIKYIDRLFYVLYQSWNQNDKVIFRTFKKSQNVDDVTCFSYINYFDIFLKNTKNTFEDKKIAFSEIEEWYLNNPTFSMNKNTREKAIEVFKLYLNNEYVSKEDKKNSKIL